MATTNSTTIGDLPEVILSNIIGAISDTRSRNSASLVCQKWLTLERATRTRLSLRGNIRDLFMLPNCFKSITHLDLSFLSPWGHPLFSLTAFADSGSAAATDPLFISHLLHQAFPSLTSLTVYTRHPSTLSYLIPQWSMLNQIKLVRWHQRPQLAPGEELNQLFSFSPNLMSLDLSNFYCWTDDIPASLEANPAVSANLTSINLLNPSFSEGFKSDEIKAISKACRGLKQLRVACMFDPRYIGCVGDEALVTLASNCERLSVLELVDVSILGNSRGGGEGEGEAEEEDARITIVGLIEVFSRLTLLEELCLDVVNRIRDTGQALEVLTSKCRTLRSLKLGKLQGISMPVESKLDGVALCQGLESLSVRNVKDLTDMGLIAIGRGCSRLSKFEIQGCEKITVNGMRTFATLLKKTLVEVKISCCRNLGAATSLKALEPIQDRVKRLHIDCVWDSVEQVESVEGLEYRFDLNTENGEMNQLAESSSVYDGNEDDDDCRHKRRKYLYDLNSSYVEACSYVDGYHGRTWHMLQSLSLWIPVGELLNPLADAGLENCPNLEEIRIKVEGDCRAWLKPSGREFGLRTLDHYQKLSKMQLDCGDIIGYAHTAPSGQIDLSSWERFYLYGIGSLTLGEIDYWPPQDRDVNQRSLSLPAAGLLSECLTLRKLFIHGTAHEHFMNFFLRIPNLRDFQLREDYYPAPENDMSTEMRADSLSRFEAALNGRIISD